MSFTIDLVPANEVNPSRSKWGDLFDNLQRARESGHAVFVHPFTKADAQNAAGALRRGGKLSLRWRTAEREGQQGMYLWVEPQAPKP